jgi:hypothetical protein
VDLLVRGGLAVQEVCAERPTLEEVVLAVTGAGSDRLDSAALPAQDDEAPERNQANA